MNYPVKPKKPKMALFRYYADVIKEVKEKYPNVKNSAYYKTIVSKMFKDLNKNEKNLKYLIPYQKEKEIYDKKIKAYHFKYGKSPKKPLIPYRRFRNKYYSKLRIKNPNLSYKEICKKVSELFKSQEKQVEIKLMKFKYKEEMEKYKKKKEGFQKKLCGLSTNGENSNSPSENLLKKKNFKNLNQYFKTQNIKKIKKSINKIFTPQIEQKIEQISILEDSDEKISETFIKEEENLIKEKFNLIKKQNLLILEEKQLINRKEEILSIKIKNKKEKENKKKELEKEKKNKEMEKTKIEMMKGLQEISLIENTENIENILEETSELYTLSNVKNESSIL